MRLLVLAALLLGLAGPAFAQAAPRTIGAPQQQAHLVPSLIVLNARQARLDGQKLVLEGVAANAIVFADRPVRAAGHALTAHVVEEWSSPATGSFARTPPNATVSALSKASSSIVDAVLVLKSARLEGDRLTFDVDILEGDLAGADGPATVFLDIVSLPVTRRTGSRATWYLGTQR
jgi:hypothetical protein